MTCNRKAVYNVNMSKSLYSGYETGSDLSPDAHVRRAFTLVELLVVILILGLLMSFLGPSLAAALKQAHIGACKTNLRELARACTSYAGEGTLHRGGTRFALPRSSELTTTNWGSLTKGNSAALWVLVKHGYAGAGLFYCPGAGLSRGFSKPAEDGIGYPHNPAGERTEFTATTISYSYISMVDPAYATTTVEDESSLVILADQNPRCTLGVTGISGKSLAFNANENSHNHGGDGQVVARLDTSAKWIEEPTGDGDDIYASTGSSYLERVGKRGKRDDVFLIP